MLANYWRIPRKLSSSAGTVDAASSHLPRTWASYVHRLLRSLGYKDVGRKFNSPRNSFFHAKIRLLIGRILQTHCTYDMERLNIEAFSSGNVPIAAPRINKFADEDSDFDNFPKYPLELLRSEASRLPDSIDPKMKELYLTHDDFVSIFHMNYAEFAVLPTWKKQELKKCHKLFWFFFLFVLFVYFLLKTRTKSLLFNTSIASIQSLKNKKVYWKTSKIKIETVSNRI